MADKSLWLWGRFLHYLSGTGVGDKRSGDRHPPMSLSRLHWDHVLAQGWGSYKGQDPGVCKVPWGPTGAS